MYYKFSCFTQRLTGAAASTAYSPQGLRPNVPESPTVIFATPTKLATEPRVPVEFLGRNRVPELQKLFQAKDGVPIHLKRGLPDRLLYRSTMALTVGGMFYIFYALYITSRPPEND